MLTSPLHDFLNKDTGEGMKTDTLHHHTVGRSIKQRAYLPLHFSPLLSYSYGERVEHFRVLEGGGQYCIWDESFRSLNRLVDFYRTHSIAVENVVYLKDPPSSPRLLSYSGHNPYPNPYKSSSQESLPSARLYSHPSHPERESSRRPLPDPAVGV